MISSSRVFIKIAALVIVILATAFQTGSGAASGLNSSPNSNTVVNPSIGLDSSSTSLIDGIVTFEALGYPKDETVQGITASRTFGFHWPETWKVQPDSAVTIQFSHSPMLAEYSSMTVDFNYVRIGSVALLPDNTDHSSISFSIPGNLFQPGYNSLTVAFYMGMHANQCEDVDNPGVWATIHNASYFEFDHAVELPVPNLNSYPAPFLDRSDLTDNRITVVIPEEPGLSELGALANINAKLGQLSGTKKLDIRVLTESQLAGETGENPGHLIYVGLVDHLGLFSAESLPFINKNPEGLAITTLDGVSVGAGDGVLWLDSPPGMKDSARLIVTGETDEALTLAARALSNETVFPLLNGQLGIIQGIAEPSATSEQIEPTLSLQQLGYEDQTAHGSYQQALSYILRLTSEWQVLTEATLDLHFAHSGLLYSQGSALTVSFNGTPVGNTSLNEENSNDGHFTARIPARLFEIGPNEISIVTNAQLPYDPEDEYQCNQDHFYDAWVTVYSDSKLTLPSGPTQFNLDLSNYPYGFMGTANLSDLEFVVPAKPTVEIAQALAWISAGLGRYSSGEELVPQVVSDEAQAGGSSDVTYQFILGEPVQNKMIHQINPLLPMPFTEGQNTPQNPELLPQVMPTSKVKSIGYLEAAMTEAGQTRLVVTGNNGEGLTWAARALSEDDLLAQIEGDLVILQSPDSVYTTSLRNSSITTGQATDSTTGTPVETTLNTPSARWVVWLALGIFLVTFLILGSSLLTGFLTRKR